MIKSYVLRPPVYKAVQWTGDNYDEILEFLGKKAFTQNDKKEVLWIQSPDGLMRAHKDDYLVQIDDGRIYPYPPDRFLYKYKEAD